MGRGRATIADVARTAGVSPATVSRVLNGSTAVSGDLATRVRAAAAETGYQPFGPARALRLRRTPVWSVIVADIENPFFTSVLRGVEDVAREHDHRVLLGNSDEDLEREAAYLDTASAEQMAGVVIAVASTADSQLVPLLDAGIPIVAVDRRPERHAVDSVIVDNRRGAALAAEHLLEAGYRRIACVTGPARLSTANERLEGYAAVVERPISQRANFRQDGGSKAAAALLAGDDPPDAFFVANNLMTIGVLEAIRSAGLRVGADVGVVGFDDAPWASLIDPPLTVVAQPAREIGREAARLLVTPSADGTPREVVLQPELIVRTSTTRH
jgi:LacI family transcriptional regulator